MGVSTEAKNDIRYRYRFRRYTKGCSKDLIEAKWIGIKRKQGIKELP